MDNEQEQQMIDWQQEVEAAMQDEGLVNIYFNGFINVMGSGDVTLILKRDGVHVAKLNTSYTVAKTLAIKLQELIGSLEMATHNTIMTTDEISQAMSADRGDG
jgi:hypothetical protein